MMFIFFVSYSAQDSSTYTSQEQSGNKAHEIEPQSSSQAAISQSASQVAGCDHEKDPNTENGIQGE